MDRSPFGGNVKTICLSIVCLLCVACPRPIGNASKSSQRSFKFESNQDNSAVLAMVGNTQVTVAQIQKLLNKQSPYVRAEYKKDPAALDKFIEHWQKRMLFFRLNQTTIEVIEQEDDLPPGDQMWGLAWEVKDIEKAHERMTAEGIEVTPIQKGVKEKTLVATIKSHNHNVPTLLIQHLD